MWPLGHWKLQATSDRQWYARRAAYIHVVLSRDQRPRQAEETARRAAYIHSGTPTTGFRTSHCFMQTYRECRLSAISDVVCLDLCWTAVNCAWARKCRTPSKPGFSDNGLSDISLVDADMQTMSVEWGVCDRVVTGLYLNCFLAAMLTAITVITVYVMTPKIFNKIQEKIGSRMYNFPLLPFSLPPICHPSP